MQMTTSRLVALRLFGLTLGHIGVASRLLKKALVGAMVKRHPRTRYMASSRLFTWDQLDEG